MTDTPFIGQVALTHYMARLSKRKYGTYDIAKACRRIDQKRQWTS